MHLPFVCAPLLSGETFRFFINRSASTEIHTLSLHDALPISAKMRVERSAWRAGVSKRRRKPSVPPVGSFLRSEEHTSELQSRLHLVCRLLLEKKQHRRPARFYASE